MELSNVPGLLWLAIAVLFCIPLVMLLFEMRYAGRECAQCGRAAGTRDASGLCLQCRGEK